MSFNHPGDAINHPYILASTSPRRQELLTYCQIKFSIAKPDFDEDAFWQKKKMPANHQLQLEQVCLWTEELALAKAASVQKDLKVQAAQATTIIGADTLIFCEGAILGKPKDEVHAIEILQKLSGRTHQVITAVALLKGETSQTFHSCSNVLFYPENKDLILKYVQTKSPLDKAGAYGIQDMGALFIKEIKGDYYAIMGLPISQLFRYLREEIDEENQKV